MASNKLRRLEGIGTTKKVSKELKPFETATSTDAEGDPCCICLTDLLCQDEDSKAVKKLSCGHLLHENCLDQVIKCAGSIYNAKCPLCRAQLNERPTTLPERSHSYWHRVEVEWRSSIEDEYMLEADSHRIRRSFAWRITRDEEMHSDSGSGTWIGDEQLLSNERSRTLPRAETVWREYRDQMTSESAEAMLRAGVAWKEYEDHIENERSEYESRAASAWEEQEHRILLDGLE